MAHDIERAQSRKFLGFGLLSAALALSGCLDRNSEVLPGPREDLRAVLVDADPTDVVENTSVPIALGATQSNANWAQFWGSPSERTAHPALGAAPQLIWSNNIGAGNTRKQRITADPVIAGGQIFTLDSAARVTATSTSGTTTWVQELASTVDGAEDATGGGIAYADGRLYVGLGFGTMTALDASDGSVLWTQELDAAASGAPSVAGDLVYFATSDNIGWALEKDTGRIRWQLGSAEGVNSVIGAPAPAITSDLAIFAFGSGDVQAVFRRGGLRRWGASVVGERRGFALSKVSDITAAPVVDRDRVYLGNQSGRVVALGVGNGSRLWTAQEGAIGPIWPAGNSVFFMTDRNELVRLSSEDGGKIWGVKLPNFVQDRPRKRAEVYAHFGPVVAGGRVVLVSSDGIMRSFDPTDGTLVGQTEIPDGAAGSAAIAGGTLYVINTRGDLLAYR